MEVTTTKMPEGSILYPNLSTYSYIDSYEGIITDESNRIDVTAYARLFLKPGPKWVDWLFGLRNKIVSLFGLKVPENSINADNLSTLKFEKGMQAGLFRVFDVAENEIILGEDDKHLTFRVSLLVEGMAGAPSKKVVTVTTVVVFNNWFGRLYFLPVKPFHRLIVKRGLRGCLRELAIMAA